MGAPATGNAPVGDPGTQHCVTAGAVVVVVDVVVVLVGAVVVVVVDVVVVEVDVVVDVGVVVVVSGAQETSTRRLAASSVAQAAPVNVAPVPRMSCALGALMNARISLWAPNLTLSPSTLTSGVGVSSAPGSTLPFPSRRSPATLITDCVGPAI